VTSELPAGQLPARELSGGELPARMPWPSVSSSASGSVVPAPSTEVSGDVREPLSPNVGDPLRRNTLWRAIQFCMQNVFCFWLQYRATGLQHLPHTGGALLLINHQSFLDPLLVGLPLSRPVSYLARDSLFKVPVVGWVLKNTYVMPINRQAASTATLREALRRLDQGFLVGVFPEGTRTESGEIGPFKPGFVSLVRRSQVPVIPVGVAGAFEAYPRSAWFPMPGVVRVVFGPPLDRQTLSGTGREQDGQFLDSTRAAVMAVTAQAQRWRDAPGSRTDHADVLRSADALPATVPMDAG
jgi:1-acyl-sn-glycerol-3-phosphate acyltransferase